MPIADCWNIQHKREQFEHVRYYGAERQLYVTQPERYAGRYVESGNLLRFDENTVTDVNDTALGQENEPSPASTA